MKELARVIGPLLILVGGIFTTIGLISFFGAFGSSGPPENFWCAFVGLPMIGIGIVMTKFAYLKPISNYLESETHDAVGNAAKNIGRNINVSSPKVETEIIRCVKCNASNKTSSKFCNECGNSVQKSINCSGCNELNDADAKFCDNCGKPIA